VGSGGEKALATIAAHHTAVLLTDREALELHTAAEAISIHLNLKSSHLNLARIHCTVLHTVGRAHKSHSCTIYTVHTSTANPRSALLADAASMALHRDSQTRLN